MAKWGEGDPRWIVEDRPDATNVNNWHWTEKNATHWSKERLHQLLNGLKIDSNDAELVIEEVEKCNGEATANNRKGKLIFFYDWELELKWSGRLSNSDDGDTHKGKINIPNLSEENDVKDVEITVSIEKSGNESEELKQIMYKTGRDKIREQLYIYIKELKEEYSKGLILPKKGEEVAAPTQQQQPVNNEEIKKFKSGINNANNNNKSSDANKVGCKLDVQTLHMEQDFQCTANDLYNALTKVEMLTIFTRGPAKSEPYRGGEFSLYGGNVQGKFEELIPEKRISQSWRLNSWPSGHYSKVTIELEETQNYTKLKLNQTGIPTSEFKGMETNWHRYYWHSIKQLLGFGSSIMDAL